MILLSNGGHNTQRSNTRSDTIVIGTVDGISILHRSDAGWRLAHKALDGCFVSAVTVAEDGTLFCRHAWRRRGTQQRSGKELDMDQRRPRSA